MRLRLPKVPLLAVAALLLATVAAFAPTARGQEHEHGSASGILIAHEAPEGGRLYVGGLAHFAAVVVGDDTEPDPHQDLHLRVLLNNATLFETTPASGHDYDGINTFALRFPVAGEYAVLAIQDDGHVANSFRGRVEPARPGPEVAFRLDGPDAPAALAPATFTLTAETAGAVVAHSDALFEVEQGGQLLFRTKTHAHHGAQEAQYAFPAPGAYTVRAVFYVAHPDGATPEFAPAVVEKTLQVGPPDPTAIPPSSPPTASPAVQPDNVVVKGSGDEGIELYGTYDPYTVAGPATLMHLGVLAMDPATGEPRPHVDFTARLTGPTGIVLFESASLHEYDGILEVATVQPLPGPYLLAVDAAADGWTGRVEIPYTVTLPAMAATVEPPSLAAGPQLYGVTGGEGIRGGEATTLTVSARDLAGEPLQHSEVEARLLGSDGVPILLTKLHTHGDGDFPFQVAFPSGGEYSLRLSPFPLAAQPVGPYLTADLGTDLAFPLSAAAGTFPAAPAPETPAPTTGTSNDVPAPALAFAVLALAAAAWTGRRR